jgi:Bacteriophage holin family
MKFLFEAFLAFALSIVIPVLPFLQAVTVVFFVDFLIGVSAAMYLGEQFQWKKALLLLVKIVCFSSLLVSIFVIQKTLEITQPNFAGLVAGAFGLIELKSIDKNIEKLFGFSIWKYLLKKVSALKELDDSLENKDNAADTDNTQEKKDDYDTTA